MRDVRAMTTAVVPGEAIAETRDLYSAAKIGLMLRSAPKERVSKHEAASSFETPPSAAPQDEADGRCGVWVPAFAGTTAERSG